MCPPLTLYLANGPIPFHSAHRKQKKTKKRVSACCKPVIVAYAAYELSPLLVCMLGNFWKTCEFLLVVENMGRANLVSYGDIRWVGSARCFLVGESLIFYEVVRLQVL